MGKSCLTVRMLHDTYMVSSNLVEKMKQKISHFISWGAGAVTLLTSLGPDVGNQCYHIYAVVVRCFEQINQTVLKITTKVGAPNFNISCLRLLFYNRNMKI